MTKTKEIKLKHKYYEIITHCTGKTISSNKTYSLFDEHSQTFHSLKSVKKYLKETYGNCNCKKTKMYIDRNNTATHCGWIYHFKNSDISHNSKSWWQLDWVEVREINAKTIIV